MNVLVRGNCCIQEYVGKKKNIYIYTYVRTYVQGLYTMYTKINLKRLSFFGTLLYARLIHINIRINLYKKIKKIQVSLIYWVRNIKTNAELILPKHDIFSPSKQALILSFFFFFFSFKSCKLFLFIISFLFF